MMRCLVLFPCFLFVNIAKTQHLLVWPNQLKRVCKVKEYRQEQAMPCSIDTNSLGKNPGPKVFDRMPGEHNP